MSDSNRRSTKVINHTIRDHYASLTLMDHLVFIFYCALLCVPAYAIVNSAINQNWLMMVVDALFVPVGFVHGVLLLLGLLQ